MPDLVYSKDGKEFVELEDTPENRAGAEAKGYKQYVDMYKDDPEDIVTVPVEDSTRALKEKGYKIKGVAVPEIEKREEDPWKTGTQALAKGVLRGATLGASEAGLSALGLEEQAEELEKKHPYISAGAEVAGAIASPLSYGRLALGALAKTFPHAARLLNSAKALTRLKGGGKLAQTTAVAAKTGGKGAFIGASDAAAQKAIEGGSVDEIIEAANTGAAFGGGLSVLAKGGIETIISAGKFIKKRAERVKSVLLDLPDQVNQYGKSREALLETAEEYKLLPGATQGYDTVLPKANTAVKRAEDRLNKLYDDLDEAHAAPGIKEEAITEFRDHYIASKARPEGNELKKQLEPLQNDLDNNLKELELVKKSRMKPVRTVELKMKLLNSKKDHLQQELEDLKGQQFRTSPAAVIDAKIATAKEALKKALSKKDDKRATIIKGQIDELYNKSTIQYPQYKDIAQRSKALDKIEYNLDLLKNQYSEVVEKAELGMLKDMNRISKNIERLNRNIALKQVRPEFRGVTEDLMDTMSDLLDDPGFQGFSGLRAIKQHLYKVANDVGGSKAEKYRDMANEFDKYLKAKVSRLGSVDAEEFIAANDELSKLLSLQQNLYKLSGKDFKNSGMPSTSSAWGAYYVMKGNLPLGLIASAPKAMKAPRVRGTLAKVTQPLGERMERARSTGRTAEGLARVIAASKKNNKEKDEFDATDL